MKVYAHMCKDCGHKKSSEAGKETCDCGKEMEDNGFASVTSGKIAISF